MKKIEEIIMAMNTAFDAYQELQEIKDLPEAESHRKFLENAEKMYREKTKELIGNEEIESNAWDMFLRGDDEELKTYLKMNVL